MFRFLDKNFIFAESWVENELLFQCKVNGGISPAAAGAQITNTSVYPKLPECRLLSNTMLFGVIKKLLGFCLKPGRIWSINCSARELRLWFELHHHWSPWSAAGHLPDESAALFRHHLPEEGCGQVQLHESRSPDPLEMNKNPPPVFFPNGCNRLVPSQRSNPENPGLPFLFVSSRIRRWKSPHYWSISFHCFGIILNDKEMTNWPSKQEVQWMNILYHYRYKHFLKMKKEEPGNHVRPSDLG